MSKAKPMTFYPGMQVRQEIERIGEDDHDRPQSKVVELAVKAFVVMYQRDKYEALKLADEFETATARR